MSSSKKKSNKKEKDILSPKTITIASIVLGLVFAVISFWILRKEYIYALVIAIILPPLVFFILKVFEKSGELAGKFGTFLEKYYGFYLVCISVAMMMLGGIVKTA